MADTDPAQTPPTGDLAPAGQQPPAAPASQQPAGNPAGDQHVPYARFKQVNDQLADLKQQIAALSGEKQQATAQQQTLEQRLATLEQERADAAAENLRLKVAGKKQLPEDLADRLRGATLEELEADADRLLAHLKPKAGPGVPPPGGGGKPPAFDLKGKTAAEIRQARKDGKI